MKRSPYFRYLVQNKNHRRAFTLIELLVSLAIFGLMTALMVAKYGTFNQSVLLTNMAYDVALTIRTAQTYGLSVKSTNNNLASYSSAYGVKIGNVTGSCANNNAYGPTTFLMYADTDTTVGCSSSDLLVSAYALKRGAEVSRVCVRSTGSCTLGSGVLDISFKRPDPRAIICLGNNCTGNTYAEIEIKATDGGIRKVSIRSNGQISVID